MPNPQDTIQAIDAVTVDLVWECLRDRPDDLGAYMIGSLIDTNRNIAIHGELIFTSMDDHLVALHAETGEWCGTHLEHPFERLLVDTAARLDASAVSWINPRLIAGEVRGVVTGIPGTTGIVYTLDREIREFLWATPTIVQNVVSGIDGATGAVTEYAELIFTAAGQTVLACTPAPARTGSPYADCQKPEGTL